MVSDNTPQRGNRPADYKKDMPDMRKEKMRVKAWRQRIQRAGELLNLDDRAKAADRADEYLRGTHEAKNHKAVYYDYLRPLLEDSYRRTLPDLPDPSAEARSAVAMPFEQMAKELLTVSMTTRAAGVLETCDTLQWDDGRSGRAFAKTVWSVDSEPATQADTDDPVQLAIEIDRVEAEHINIATAQVTESDIDSVHLDIHQGYLEQGTPDAEVIAAHMQEHIAQMTVITIERPVLERVPWNRFVYDMDVSWDRRKWEVEDRSESVRDLLDLGCKNLNDENCHAEVKEGESPELPWEDRTVRVFHIHDRDKNRYYIIAKDGPEEGLFLLDTEWPYGAIDIYIPLEFRSWKPEDGYGNPTIVRCLPMLDRHAVVDFHIDRHVAMHSDYKIIGPKGAASKDTKAGLNNPDQRFVEASVEFIAGFKESKPPPIPSTLLEQWERLMAGLRHEVGADAQDTGAPNPHQVSATESAERGAARDTRSNRRHTTIGNFLEQVGLNFLALYKKFATKNVLVRILGPNGADYQTINPTEIPAEIEVYLDVQSVTEESKAQKMALADKYIAFLMQSELRVNWQEMNTYYAEITDVRHPERFVIEFAPTDPAFAGEPLQQSGNIQNQSAPIRSPESTAPDRGQLIS